MTRTAITNRIDAARSIRRVAIIGVGAVGSTFAFTLASGGHVREVVLYDKDIRRAEGEMMDISHCLPYTRPIKLSVGDLDDVAECDLIVITAGMAQQKGQTRLDLVKGNAEIFSQFFPRLPKANPHALFVIITNPVDVMTRLAWNLSEVSSQQIFGTGTVLDTARFRMLLANHLNTDARNIHAYVIGEHGDSEVLAWSRVRVGPYKLDEFCRHSDRTFTPEDKDRLTSEVRRAAYHIIERKGATNFAIGISMLRIYESIAHNMSTLQTVSRPVHGTFGMPDDMCLSLPCMIMRDGAKEPMELRLDEEEHAALMHSAEVLDDVYQKLGV